VCSERYLGRGSICAVKLCFRIAEFLPAEFCASTNRKQRHASWKKSVSATARSMFGCGMPIANFFHACPELIVQSVDLAHLTGRDILLMQGSQLMLGWLVIVTIANRPWSLAKRRGALCRS